MAEKALLNVLVLGATPEEAGTIAGLLAKQTYKNVKLLVAFEDTEAIEALEKVEATSAVPFKRVKVSRRDNIKGVKQVAPEHLHLNRMLQLVEDGFVTVATAEQLKNRFELSRRMKAAAIGSMAMLKAEKPSSTLSVTELLFHVKDVGGLSFNGTKQAAFHFANELTKRLGNVTLWENQ